MMGSMAGWRLEHTYATLPELFHTAIEPTPVRAPRLVVFNRPLADQLGLDPDDLDTPDGAAIFGGNVLPPGSRPLAQAYAGHQFGHFTGLGDGRAILLGEQITPSGDRFDIQLKGSGRTPYSRGGDGRAALGPMLREYIISEAIHALGIPTTRSLAVVATGEPVFREDELPGAVLTRVAASHIRVGTVQWAAAHRSVDALRAIADYTRKRHYSGSGEASAGKPDVADVPDADAYLALFRAIVERQAPLIAQWQLVGFIHGVMNTDNMALSGETIDYGPCAFMNAYDPGTVFSSIDRGGRYAYGNQPPIAQWNLTRLAEALLPLFDADQSRAIEQATKEIERFAELFEAHWLQGMRAKLGLFTDEDGDRTLVDDLLAWMHRESADFTNTFRDLSTVTDEAWQQRLQERRARQPESPREVEALMRRSNPAFIPRNHKVEEALDAAMGNYYSVMHRLLDVLRAPFDYSRDLPDYSTPPRDAHGYRTFCGT
jgi:serine/tyrosine/threonine adenylyltransferase